MQESVHRHIRHDFSGFTPASHKMVSCNRSRCDAKKGISANQIRAHLGVQYKTAWHLMHRIRESMQQDTKEQLKGTVEVDETYIGGRYDRRRKRGRYEKQAVMGLIERSGRVEARPIPTASKSVLVGIIKERVAPGSNVFTDELGA